MLNSDSFDTRKLMEDPINRFMRFVQKTDTCWIWKAQVMSSGYGRFWLDKKNVSAKISDQTNDWRR